VPRLLATTAAFLLIRARHIRGLSTPIATSLRLLAVRRILLLRTPRVVARASTFLAVRRLRLAASGVFRHVATFLTAGFTARIISLHRRLRIFRGAPRLARRVRRVAFGVLRIAALRVAGLHLIGGRRRILVRRSGTFGYIRHGGAL
jgi:hypothetical protein